MATDRRRINPPPPGAGGTIAPLYCVRADPARKEGGSRARQPDEIRKIFLQTQTIPHATGSAYLEVAATGSESEKQSCPGRPTLKLSGTVHVSPIPHSRNAPFAPNGILSANVKLSPFATPVRRGRNATQGLEKELGSRLESAMAGVVLGERWSKMSISVGVLVLETDLPDLDAQINDSDASSGPVLGPTSSSTSRDALQRYSRRGKLNPSLKIEGSSTGAGDLSVAHLATANCTSQARSLGQSEFALMSLIQACVNVSVTALVDAGIDTVDLPSAGMAGISKTEECRGGVPTYRLVLDPEPSEFSKLQSACLVTYLPARDEVTDCWIRGDPNELVTDGAQVRVPSGEEAEATTYSTAPVVDLMNAACAAALGANTVVQDAIGIGTMNAA